MLPRAILLAGGKSSRFGSDKSRAEVDGRTLTALCVSRLLGIFSRVIVVAKEPAGLGVDGSDRVRIVREIKPEYAALIGLRQGLSSSDRRLNYVTGCDMPGVVPELIAALYAMSRGRDCALRCDDRGRPQPLGGFYSKSALPAIQRAIADRQFRLSSLLDTLDVAGMPYDAVTRLDPRLQSFENVNTREDLNRLASLTLELTAPSGVLPASASSR